MDASSVRSNWVRVLWTLSMPFVLWACSGTSAGEGDAREAKPQAISTTSVTQSADELRTSWYPNQPQLSPAVVSGSSFGQMFSAAVNGAVYAQPLLSQGTLFVATETNNIYGLDPETGAVRWTRNVGTPFTAADIHCGDLDPNIGITGTPVIDAATNIGYFFAKRYVTGNSGAVTIEAHAIDVATGIEKGGFPVAITGTAANDATRTFQPRQELQRPGLLLMNGVIYAAFGGHCDVTPYGGWVVGVSTAGTITTLWSAQAGSNGTDGGGIWHSGSGLVSDGSGQILLITGNGGSSVGPIAGHSPPGNLGESVVRLALQPDGSLNATDFFSPYDSLTLDTWDADLGAGGPTGLPSPTFGTTQIPHLMIATGKQGYVYLLDRDNLGGIGNGPGGGDSVVSRIGPYGGVWSKPAIWPGDGGYVFLPTASGGNSAGGSSGNLRVFKYGLDGTGKPTLSLVATSSDAFGFSSSAPVVTSDQTTSGTALVWIIWSADGSGNNAQLRAYDPLPVNGLPVLRYSAPVGTSAKFVPPGVGNGRLYVGTRDGHVRAFGAPMTVPLSASSLDLGTVVVGASTQGTLKVTANAAVTVSSIASSNTEFAVGASTPALPASLAANGTLSIPVTFTPSAAGMRAGTITLQTSGGSFQVSVVGQGQSPTATLVASPAQVSFGGVPSGSQVASTVTFTNSGGTALTINRVVPPDAPFGVTGVPAPGSTLAAGASVSVTVTFTPTAIGSYMGAVALDTSAGVVEVPMSGVCAPPGHLTVTPLSVDFGSVGVGGSKVASFTVANTGGSSLRVTRSKPPAGGVFTALTTLAEGTTLLPGDSLTEFVSFIPNAVGPLTDSWSLNGDDGGGIQNVSFTGVGSQDITGTASIIALVTSPLGGGSHNLETIRDGVTPAVGSTNLTQQYDTYTGDQTRTEDWIGYQFTGLRSFTQLIFQEGAQSWDGGWFTSLRVQVRQSGAWVTVSNAVPTPAYPGANGVGFETFTFNFPAVVGDAIRIDGTPGGVSRFISVAELRVFGSVVSGGNTPPVANAGPAQEVVSGAVVTLDGSGSTDAESNPLTYAWSQTAGPAVTLSSATAVKPTFTAPTVTASTALTFSLTANDGQATSAASTVTITVDPPVQGAPDITASGTIVALITAPTGGGNHNLQIIRDGVTPPVGSTNNALQYDTYNGGGARPEDWIGYTFASSMTFSKVVFQEGNQFGDGGWFSSLKLQVRQGGAWVDVPSATVTPAYPGANGVTFETFTFTFAAVVGDGIRIDGVPGGASKFISVAELRVFGTAVTGANNPPTANAGPAQEVASGATVKLNGGASSDPEGSALTYAWAQTAGPAVTLSSTTVVQPTFTAPTVTTATALTFFLVVNDGSLSSPASTVTITVDPPVVQGAPDITSTGTIVALITAPTGGGNKNLEVIRDGVTPPVGSTNNALAYDTYNGGGARAEDWIGYTFATSKSFSKLVFQEGNQFGDGGWFTSIKVQVRQSGAWVNVPSVTVTPAYPGANGVTFETFTFTFPAISGDGIRIDGAPGGASKFISVAELRAFGAALTGNSPPTANAGAAQEVTSGATVTLDGSGSTDPDGDTLTYAWSQTAGPAVTLSSATAVKPTFTAPTVSAQTPLTFSLVVNDGTAASPAAAVTITIDPQVVGGSTDITASASIIALITAPTGGGNHNLEVIRDGVTPAPGSTNFQLQYDTYNGGGARAEDWIGYSFTASKSFTKLVFEEGGQFGDGGWFTSIKVQVRQNGTWVTVPSVTVTPSYGGANGVSFDTYTFTFPAITGDGIRIDGAPGGSAKFISCSELRVFGS